MKILVVDDDQIVLESCKRVLAVEGFEVYTASSADKALETMEKDDFDLVLIDVKMPERNGMSLIKEIKGKRPNMPRPSVSRRS